MTDMIKAQMVSDVIGYLFFDVLLIALFLLVLSQLVTPQFQDTMF